MVSFKNILSAVVLIFLFSTMTKTEITEENKKNVKQCLSEMIISCRPLEDLPSTKRCVEMAVKFWVEDIHFPAVVKKFYNTFYDIIDKNDKLENPTKYCKRISKSDEDFQECKLDLIDFGDTIEDALQFALYKKRIVEYLTDQDDIIQQLNSFGLNFHKDICSADSYESQIVGLDKFGSSVAESSTSSVKKQNTFAVNYLATIGNTIELIKVEKEISPMSFCMDEYLDPNDIKNAYTKILEYVFELLL